MTHQNAPTVPPIQTIKEEYIYGTITENGDKTFKSYRELSEQYKISLDTIKRAGSKEKWPALRKEHRTKTALKVADKKSEYSAASIVQSDDKFESTGEALRKKVMYLLDSVEYFRSSDLVNLSIALVNSQKVVKTAQGEILDRVKIESSQDVKLNITDPDFMNEELEFARKLIQDRRGGT